MLYTNHQPAVALAVQETPSTSMANVHTTAENEDTDQENTSGDAMAVQIQPSSAEVAKKIKKI